MKRIVVEKKNNGMKKSLFVGVAVMSLSMGMNGFVSSVHASSLEESTETQSEKEDVKFSLIKNDTYMFSDTNVSVVKGTAIISSGNTANVELMDEQGKHLIDVPVEYLTVSGQKIVTFDERSLETTRPAVSLKLSVLNEQGQTIYEAEKDMNLITM